MYAVFKVQMAGIHLSFQTVSSLVFSAARVLTIVFEMGTGVTPGRIDTSQKFLIGKS